MHFEFFHYKSAPCRLCRFLGACEYTDRRLRSSEGLLLLWLQRHPRASVLPSLLEAVACMSSRHGPAPHTTHLLVSYTDSTSRTSACATQLLNLRCSGIKQPLCSACRQMALEGASCNEVIMVQEFLVGIPSAAACHAQPLCERQVHVLTTYTVPRLCEHDDYRMKLLCLQHSKLVRSRVLLSPCLWTQGTIPIMRQT